MAAIRYAWARPVLEWLFRARLLQASVFANHGRSLRRAAAQLGSRFDLRVELSKRLFTRSGLT